MDFFSHLSSYLPQREIEGLRHALSLPRSYGFFINPSKVSKETISLLDPSLTPIAFAPLGFRYDGEKLSLGKSLLFDAGALYIQDPSAMLVSSFLNPKQGAKVLDLAAAPGGKTIGLALSRNDVTILANDLSYPRAKELSGNVERMGVSNVVVTSADFSAHYQDFIGYFDAIILDAPCSGSAMFRKNEEALADWSIEKVNRCAATQRSLLEMAYQMLTPSGRLIYSTCSFSKEEDIDPVVTLLSNHDDMKLVPLPDDPSFFHHPSLPEAVFLFPHHYLGEGQFIALLEKEGESQRKEEKNHPVPKQYRALFHQFGLEQWDYREHREAIYALPRFIKTGKLPVLRYGLKVAEEDKPDFALARAMDASFSIPLNEKQAHDYLLGLSIELNASKGFHIVSYRGLNLGLVKVSNGSAKNHYPKGLRHDYPLPLLPF